MAAADSTDTLVSIQGVTKDFGGTLAVDGIDLEIRRGEYFSLLGGSGCGKTTLLRMLGGFETPTSGRIMIDGQDMADVPAYRRPVNMMFQSYALFPHMSVAQNVAFGLEQEKVVKSERDDRVAEALSMVQLGEYGRRKPHQLSGGQRQRIAIARAMLKDAPILLLDEATSALDSETEQEIQGALDRAAEGRTVLMIAHRLSTVAEADQIIVLQDGEIVEQFVEAGKSDLCETDPFEVSDADTMLNHINPSAAKPKAVTVFTKPGCGHCARAKGLLEKAGLQYEEIVLGSDATFRSLRAVAGALTAPQVFIDGQKIGSADDLEKYLAA